jgi:hypothetical protein
MLTDIIHVHESSEDAVTSAHGEEVIEMNKFSNTEEKNDDLIAR